MKWRHVLFVFIINMVSFHDGDRNEEHPMNHRIGETNL